MTALPKPAYVMSEPHLSGWRVVLGYETLADAQAAQSAVSAPEAREAYAWESGETIQRRDRFHESFSEVTDADLVSEGWAPLYRHPAGPEAREGDQPTAWTQEDSLRVLRHGHVAIVYPNQSDIVGSTVALYVHPAAPSADKLRIAVEALETARDYLHDAAEGQALSPDAVRLILNGGNADNLVRLAKEDLEKHDQALTALKAEV